MADWIEIGNHAREYVPVTNLKYSWQIVDLRVKGFLCTFHLPNTVDNTIIRLISSARIILLV